MSARSPITVAIGRFEDLVALGLQALLEDDPSVTIVARDIATGRLSAVLRAHKPGVLILDAGSLRDLAQVRELAVEHPSTRLVLLGDDRSSVDSAPVLAFGAGAYLEKSTQGRDVRNAIHLASRGLQLLPRAAGDSPAPNTVLTRREGDVLLLLRQGRSNAQIALALQIGVETVRTHARSVYRKLGISSRRALLPLPGPQVQPAAPAVAYRARRRPGSLAAARRRLHD